MNYLSKIVPPFAACLSYFFSKYLITARKRSLGQGNIFSSVYQEFCSQVGGLPQCMLGYHTPLSRHPHPWSRQPPGPGTPLCAVHAGRYGQQAGGMHPTGMQSCLFLRFDFTIDPWFLFPDVHNHCLQNPRHEDDDNINWFSCRFQLSCYLMVARQLVGHENF